MDLRDPDIDSIVEYAMGAPLYVSKTQAWPTEPGDDLETLVEALSGRLTDWSREKIVHAMLPAAPVQRPAELGQTFDDVDALAREAYFSGQYSLTIALGRASLRLASTPGERARAFNRELGGWAGLGHYQNVVAVALRGMREADLPSDNRRMLESNLANAYLALWELDAARAVATRLIAWYREFPPACLRDWRTGAFAYYVRGNAYRRAVDDDAEPLRVARHAKADLAEAIRRHEHCASKFDVAWCSAVAHTCRGGLIEMEVTLGQRDAGAALAHMRHAVATRLASDSLSEGDWLESLAWWCVFACNIAMRHVDDDGLLEHHAGWFMEQYMNITQRITDWDTWTLTDCLFRICRRLSDRLPSDAIPALDGPEAVAKVIETIGRIPSFRAVGDAILSGNVPEYQGAER